MVNPILMLIFYYCYIKRAFYKNYGFFIILQGPPFLFCMDIMKETSYEYKRELIRFEIFFNAKLIDFQVRKGYI